MVHSSQVRASNELDVCRCIEQVARSAIIQSRGEDEREDTGKTSSKLAPAT